MAIVWHLLDRAICGIAIVGLGGEVSHDTWRKELQDSSLNHRRIDSEIEYGESGDRLLFHNFGISNYLFLRPDDRVERTHLLET